MSRNNKQPKTEGAADIGSKELLCRLEQKLGAFTAEEWRCISLCIGWTIAMSDGKTPEDKYRRETSMAASKAMNRVFGEMYHHQIRTLAELGRQKAA